MAKDLKLVLPADGSIQKAIAGARSAEKGPDYYVLFKFAGGAGATLEVTAEGPGGWAEASAQLTDADGAYVFIRRDHKVEMAKTVKFAYVEWFPNGLKAMRRIQLSSLKKQVEDVLKPFHVGLSASELKDVDQKLIDDRIGFVSGTKSHVKSGADAAAPAAAAEAPKADEKAVEAPAPKKATAPLVKNPTPKPAGFVSGGSGGGGGGGGGGAGGIKFPDGTALPDALKEVRDDKKDTNWVVAHYTDRDTLSFAGSGSDGFAGMMAKIADDVISFGLLRVVEQIDKSKTTKFVYVKSIPDTVKPMKRAEITTRAGAIEKVFGQAHVAFDISKKSELTEQMVTDKVGAASGSKSNVKDK
jgi:hypothetical protein